MATSDKSRDEMRTAASEEDLPLRGSREASLGGPACNIGSATVGPTSARPDDRADTERELTHGARAPWREEVPAPRGSREASLGASARKFDPAIPLPPSVKLDARADSERELTHDARFRGEDNE
jgi:hypothetical protein